MHINNRENNQNSGDTSTDATPNCLFLNMSLFNQHSGSSSAFLSQLASSNVAKNFNAFAKTQKQVTSQSSTDVSTRFKTLRNASSTYNIKAGALWKDSARGRSNSVK